MNYINKFQREADAYGSYFYEDYDKQTRDKLDDKNKIRDDKINSILDFDENKPEEKTLINKIKSIFKKQL